MKKSLTKHGNSAALVIDRPILDLLGADINTTFEVVTDGHALILTPINDENKTERFHKAMDKIGKRYAESFKELAK